MITAVELAKKVYNKLPNTIKTVREKLQKPLTLTEKILYSHLEMGDTIRSFARGNEYVSFMVDRLAMQDATAQMALLQLMNAGIPKALVPSTAHCDHLIAAETTASEDLDRAMQTNKEVYAFIESVSNKFGVGFWKPGAGIIHQVVFENYAFPAGMMVGTDSHTPNAGGLGMLAIGVGGADAVDVMVGLPWETKYPKSIGVRLTGKLQGWASPKDVILKLAGLLTTKGATGHIIEYFGDGCSTISATGKGTICNMGAEVGATTSLFPYDAKMKEYLVATGRGEIAQMADAVQEHVQADAEVLQNPENYFDNVLTIDLSTLEPQINGPFTPDRNNALTDFGNAVVENDWPKDLRVGLIGSCTNSSYEDIDRVCMLAKQAKAKNLRVKTELIITPGSEMVRATLERDGQIPLLESIGAKVLANACGPCIGQWKRHDVQKGDKNSIITSFNRNFTSRNDGNPETHAFVASPDTVFAFTLSGDLTHNFMKQPFITEQGEEVFLDPPQGEELPKEGFIADPDGYQAPAEDGSTIEVVFDPTSERIQQLAPFSAPNLETDFVQLPILLKAQGKCTTDHISPAGPWLRFRGNLENLSANLFLTAVNAFTGTPNSVKNQRTGEYAETNVVAKEYSQAGQGWMVVGDENYGEGSSREHAAMEPRYRGCRAVLVKSFARIHEANLKKQGVLPFTFVNGDDYTVLQEDDRITIPAQDIKPNTPVTLTIEHADGTTVSIVVNHSCNDAQLAWFRAGSALNVIAKQSQK